jgi:hypothetical protein
MTETGVTYSLDEFLGCMRCAAHVEAAQLLSTEGNEALKNTIFEGANRGIGSFEAFRKCAESAAFDGLGPDDWEVMNVWAARVSLIEEFETFEG